MLCGLDQVFSGELSNVRKRLRGARVGILTHAAAVDRSGRNAVSTLDELGASPAVVFTPEHGFFPTHQAQVPISEVPPSPDQPRFVSLYGSKKESLTPSAQDLEGLDVLVIDLCDVGSRYYTYVWTALLAARAAVAAGVHTLILDRPNPISGTPTLAEGKPQEADYLSFVGLESLPVRHGLTLGELVCLFLERDGATLGAEGAVSVVPVLGWERHQTASAWNRPFSPPSPNMPSLETALVYPGACLLEGTNLSEGRGTTLPFQMVGAPFLDAAKLATACAELGAPGAQIRPVHFQPTFDKHAGAVCHGVLIQVTNWRLFRPIATYLSLLALAKAQAPDTFKFTTGVYEFETGRPAFDLLTGSDAARLALVNQATPADLQDLVCRVDAGWADVMAEAEARVERARG